MRLAGEERLEARSERGRQERGGVGGVGGGGRRRSRCRRRCGELPFEGAPVVVWGDVEARVAVVVGLLVLVGGLVEDGGGDVPEGDGVGGAVAEEMGAGAGVVVGVPALPEVDGLLSVGADEVVWSFESEGLLDGLESAGEVAATADPAEVDVWGEEVGGEGEGLSDDGEVEGGAVEGDEELGVEEEVGEVVEVLAVDEEAELGAVPAGDDGDVGVALESGGLDVEEDALGPVPEEYRSTVLLGFGGLGDREIQQGAQLLSAAWNVKGENR